MTVTHFERVQGGHAAAGAWPGSHLGEGSRWGVGVVYVGRRAGRHHPHSPQRIAQQQPAASRSSRPAATQQPTRQSQAWQAAEVHPASAAPAQAHRRPSAWSLVSPGCPLHRGPAAGPHSAPAPGSPGLSGPAKGPWQAPMPTRPAVAQTTGAPAARLAGPLLPRGQRLHRQTKRCGKH